MTTDRIYLLSATDRNLDLLRLDSGEICLHCPALVSASDAQQIAHGLLALLSGEFDRATSEYTLRFDLARRRSQSDSAPITPPATLHQPELDSL